jgi:NADPH2:quinone reductase
MQAWRMTRTGEPADVLAMAECPEPVARPGEITVAVECAGLSFADLLLIRGEYQVALPLPCVPGSEVVGRVVSAGPGTSLLPGDRVVGLVRWPDGGFAESAAMVEQHAFPVPEDLPAPVAACLGNYVTAHLALHRRAAVRADDVVLVHGAAGGVGDAAVRLAKVAGATVIGADLGPERAQSCLAAGADVAVDVTDSAALTAAVREHTDGRGADLVVDMVGGGLFEVARRVIAYEGRIVIVGFTSGTIPQLRMNQLILRSYTVMGVNALSTLTQHTAVYLEAHEAVLALLTDGAIAPPVADVRPMAELVELITTLDSRKTEGKPVLRVRTP